MNEEGTKTLNTERRQKTQLLTSLPAFKIDMILSFIYLNMNDIVSTTGYRHSWMGAPCWNSIHQMTTEKSRTCMKTQEIPYGCRKNTTLEKNVN